MKSHSTGNVRSAASSFVALGLLLLLVAAPACRRKPRTKTNTRVQVIATLFPTYDFARQIGGDRVQVKLILPPGVEAHHFDPSPRDIMRIHGADLFVHTGRLMEPWTTRILKNVPETVLIVDASKEIHHCVGHCTHGHGGHEAQDGSHKHDLDPHIWLDLERAQTMVDHILEGLVKRDPDNREFYRKNASAYKKKLADLDERNRRAFAGCKQKTIISGGHFAFSYYAERYGLKHVSPYPGFSPDSEPSPKAIARLIKKLKKLETKAIFFEEMLEPSVARLIAKETGAKLLLLHGAHNLSREEFERGETYLGIMEGNLKRLKEGLGYKGEK